MIRPLRRYHYFGWQALAVALPILFIVTLLMRPQPAHKEVADRQFKFSHTRQSDSTYSVSVSLVSPLTDASCLVFGVVGTDRELHGAITDQGAYTFLVNVNTEKLILHDGLRKRDIIEYSLQP